jgi:hypothetical protein
VYYRCSVCELFFPLWYRYYGSLFGSENLFVVTYQGHSPQFRPFDLGSLWQVNRPYSETLRAALISDFVAVLLRTYDIVIRCDVDEILVADPRTYRNLADYVEQIDSTHVTAIGFDLLEDLPDLPLEMEQPIVLAQRKLAMPSSFLHKTSLTTIPLRWAEGFHACSAVPKFSALFNFHLKFTDVSARVSWFRTMLQEALSGSREEEYFRDGEIRLLGHQRWCCSLPTRDDDGEFMSAEPLLEFLKTVQLNQDTNIYQGKMGNADFTRLIPRFFYGVF